MKILLTRDYDQFKTVPGNRNTDINHINNLIKLNAKENMLWMYPATVTKDNYLIDGQNRREACRAQDWEFPYVVSDKTLAELGDNIVALTNTAQKGWRPPNFIDFYAAHGKEQYLFLRELMDEHKFTHPIIMQLVVGKTGSADIKLGNLKLYTSPDEKRAVEEILAEYAKLKGTITGVVLHDSRFASAMRTVFKDYTAEEIITQLARTPLKVTSQRGVKDYLRVMEDVINYKKHERNYMRFF